MESLVWTITYEPATGQLGVSGPMENLILTLGVLERAKDNARLFVEQQNAKVKLMPVHGHLNGNGVK